MTTLIVVTSSRGIARFVSLATRFATTSAFPTLAVYRGHDPLPAAELDSIDGVSWLGDLDLEHHYADSIERLQIRRLVLQLESADLAEDRCPLLLHHARQLPLAEVVILDPGDSTLSARPERVIVPVPADSPAAALRLAADVCASDGWTVVAGVADGRLAEQRLVERRLAKAAQVGVGNHPRRLTTVLLSADSEVEGLCELLTEHDLLLLGGATLEQMRRLRLGRRNLGVMSIPRGVAMAAVLPPVREDGAGPGNAIRRLWNERIRSHIPGPCEEKNNSQACKIGLPESDCSRASLQLAATQLAAWSSALAILPARRTDWLVAMVGLLVVVLIGFLAPSAFACVIGTLLVFSLLASLRMDRLNEDMQAQQGLARHSRFRWR